MAAVYKARDRALGRLVAVKVLHESFTSDEGFLRRFQQEAYSAANLTHPNIVTVHDIGQDGYTYYIVMELVEGQTLKQIIRGFSNRHQMMPLNQALDLAIGVCNGIGYAHRAGLVHCDVKPHNVIVTPDQMVKVADFGIARAVTSATQQQIVSQVWGTPQYFAPEQASGKPTTPATDVYAIGIVLFEMLTGRLPFEAESHTAMALKHLHEPPPKVTDYNTAVPAQISEIINKLLAKEPAGRYRTAGQLGRILTTYRQRSNAETGPRDALSTPTPTTPTPQENTPVAEQLTQIYERPQQDTPVRPTQDRSDETTKVYAPNRDASTRQPVRETALNRENTAVTSIFRNENEEPDWTVITLGIAAIVAMLGLIPLWIIVYLAWTQ